MVLNKAIMDKSTNKNNTRSIRITGIKQNNLKNIDIEFPAKKISVVTGLSGSGKSSLVFDTLYAEGQRRYIESLSTYTRQFLEKMPKPEIEKIENIPPAIALEQKNTVLNSRSTVGTQTEIVDYMRLLYSRLGKTHCLTCGTIVKKLSSETILEWALEWLPEKKSLILAPLQLQAQNKNNDTDSKKAERRKSPSATKTKASKPVSTDQVIQLIREQGFTRVFIKTSAKKGEMLELDDLNIQDIAKKDLWIVIDRLKLSSKSINDEKSRISDSIDQAITVGRGKVVFYDIDGSEFKEFDCRFACPKCNREHRVPEPQLFSFNNPLGACSSCSGFGYNLELDERLIVPDPQVAIKNGAIDPFSKPSFSEWQKDLFRFAERQGIAITKKYSELTATQKKLLWDGDPTDKSFPGIRGCFAELAQYKYKLHVRVFIRRYQSQSLCYTCKGSRLTQDALAVRVGEYHFADVLNIPVVNALEWLESLKFTPSEKQLGKELLFQIHKRLHFLNEVGVGYLTLSRLAKTLSGGEFQRINLATQLGNGLCGTLYILDEPSIGLHPSDTARLIRVLKRLRDQGNTVVIVEHDLEVMKAADWLVELGPLAGRNGGQLVAQGTAQDLAKNSKSVTGQYVAGTKKIERIRAPRPAPKRWIKLTGCQENNLKNIDVDIPLDRLVVVTGVSGSGKSSLVHKTLHTALSKIFYKTTDEPGRFERLYGADQIQGVALLDQSPIGRSSRSNPATYLKAWDEIRRIYANQVLSLKRGYTTQHFSFNVDGGRCPICKGEGEVSLDMHFMADLKLPCEECGGKRFKKNVLDVTYKGKDIYQLLQITIDEAYEMFRDNSILSRKMNILRDVGLGYLQLGQSGTTLSGGESQRLKIAATLDEKQNENLLYIFDEPTTGLHLDDIKRLLGVIQDLVDARHSVVMIEHQIDVIAQADWIIDLGPGGGEHGGELVASGPPSKLIHDTLSVTGHILKDSGYTYPENENSY